VPENPWIKGLSGIYAIWKNSSATLLQHGMRNLQKRIVSGGYDVYRKEKKVCMQ
jgi:hypothetical protein